MASARNTKEVIDELKNLTNGLVDRRILGKNKLESLVASAGLTDRTTYVKLPEDVEDGFNTRTAADASVRRLRLRDIYPHLTSEEKHAVGFLTGMDLIAATNVTVWILIHGVNKFNYLKKHGWWNSTEDFLTASSTAASEIKRMDGDWFGWKQALAEVNVLTGYLQNDLEEVDWHEKLLELAHGGNEHGLVNSDWDSDFKEALTSTTGLVPKVKQMTLREYIESKMWLTAGSSSIGEVKWTFDEKSGKFKARKNMLTYLFTVDELVDMVYKWNGRLMSKAFTKDELSKRRIAVASNIEAYLSESYVLYHLGHPYKNWEYFTLDESPGKQHARNADIMSLLQRGEWALPFDFKNFDHQPTTKEIQMIVNKYIELINAGNNMSSDFELISRRVVASYENSVIEMSKNGKTWKETVTGGLPSGVRLTSLLGNQWNAAMTHIVRGMASKLCGLDLTSTIGIKGDDTYIISSSPGFLACFRLCYEAINAIGLDAKFAIMPTECEFLRNAISKSGIRGWSNRAIPTLTQRKPWSPQPWKPDAAVATVADGIWTLERRLGYYIPRLHMINRKKWSKFTGQSDNWLRLPIRMGGYGIYPFAGKVPNNTLPTIELPKINTNIPKHNAIEQPKWIKLNEEQFTAYQQVGLTQMMATDDIPGTQSVFGRKFLNNIRNLRVEWADSPLVPDPKLWKKVRGPSQKLVGPWPSDKVKVDYNDELEMSVTQFLREAKLVQKVVDIPIAELLKQFYPYTYIQMKAFETRGWHRADAIDLAQGITPTERVTRINPILTSFVKEAVQNTGVRFWRGRKNIASKLYQVTENAVLQLSNQSIYTMYNY